MISTTGSQCSPVDRSSFRHKKGLTFIEVMVTVVILTGGLVAIYRAFFVGVDYLDRLAYRLQALSLINSKMSVIERDFQSLQDFDVGALSEVVEINNRPVEFYYTIDLQPVGELLSIFRLDITLSWSERGRLMDMSRSAYFSGITSLVEGGKK